MAQKKSRVGVFYWYNFCGFKDFLDLSFHLLLLQGVREQ